ncbi:hypothetical protein LEN26_002237 [Aphanomyces euteiches]|nr:hypothetical protein LEN26_002237 [Aphanomyces euteiches]KAH9183083.1 hypothetical protein AeNC1_014941 [Aphanomyces euteiches]
MPIEPSRNEEEQGAVTKVENIIVQRQTVGSRAASVAEEETKAAVEAIAATQQAHQQLTYEQLNSFWDDHQALRRDTGMDFEVQQQRQDELRQQLNDQRRLIDLQQDMLQQAAVAVNQQSEEIGELTETILSPRRRSRWGLFAESGAVDAEMEDEVDTKMPPGVMSGGIVAGGNLPTPPVYKGCTKREKRDFMDRHLSFQRRLQALGEGTGRSIALIPIGACVDHNTLISICMFEVKKRADEMTEQDWKNYFLAAKLPNGADYTAIETAIKSQSMDIGTKDGQIRRSRHGYLETKLCIKLSCRAIRPTTLKLSVENDLQKERCKKLRSDITQFVDWLIQRVSAFLTFESSLPKTFHANEEGNKTKNKKAHAAVARAGNSRNQCLKYGARDHGVFKCPDVKPDEAKKLWYEFKKRRQTLNTPARVASGAANSREKAEDKAAKTGSSVGHINPPKSIGAAVSDKHDSWIAASVGGVPAKITLDTGADCTVVSSLFVQKLENASGNFKLTKLDQPVTLLPFSNETMKIENEVQFDLSIPTDCGVLVLRNSRLGSPNNLYHAVWAIFYCPGVMKTLGFDQHEMLAQARRHSPEYEVRGVVVRRSAEEDNLEPLENVQFLPALDGEPREEEAAVLKILQRNMDDALESGASRAYVSRTRDVL